MKIKHKIKGAEMNEFDEIIAISDMIVEVVHILSSKRVEMGFTQKEFAKKIGMTHSELSRFEKLDAIPRIDTVAKIAYSLGVKIFAFDYGIRDRLWGEK